MVCRQMIAILSVSSLTDESGTEAIRDAKHLMIEIISGCLSIEVQEEIRLGIHSCTLYNVTHRENIGTRIQIRKIRKILHSKTFCIEM